MQERRWGTAVLAGNWSSSCRQAVVAGDAAAACPGTAAVGPQTGQPRGGGVQTVVQDLACPLPSIYPPTPPSPRRFLFPFFARIHSIPPACGRDRRVQGRLLFPDTVSREKKYRLSLGRNPGPCLAAETQILHCEKTKSLLILLRHSTISCAQSQSMCQQFQICKSVCLSKLLSCPFAQNQVDNPLGRHILYEVYLWNRNLQPPFGQLINKLLDQLEVDNINWIVEKGNSTKKGESLLRD